MDQADVPTFLALFSLIEWLVWVPVKISAKVPILVSLLEQCLSSLTQFFLKARHSCVRRLSVSVILEDR